MAEIRIIKHEAVPKCGSFEVRFSDGRPSKYFYWDARGKKASDLAFDVMGELAGTGQLYAATSSLPEEQSLKADCSSARRFPCAPFLFELKGTPAEYKAGPDYGIAKGWLVLHESGTYVRFTDTGAGLFV